MTQGRLVLQPRFEFGRGVWQVSAHPPLPNNMTHRLFSTNAEYGPPSFQDVFKPQLALLIEVCA